MSLPKTFTAGERLFASDLNDNFNNLDGRVDTVETSGYRFAGTRYYTSSGTFAKADPLGTGDIGLRAIRVRSQGGGGAGGGADVTAASEWSGGSGGAGGNYSESFITDIAGLDASVDVTRGAGGTPAAAGNGGAGGESSFGSLVRAAGGLGGTKAGASGLTRHTRGGLPAAAGPAGDLQVRGGTGASVYLSAFDYVRGVSGEGGPSHLGGGATSVAVPDNGFGGAQFGGGGGGGLNSESNATSRSGGAGANGIVIVDCFV